MTIDTANRKDFRQALAAGMKADSDLIAVVPAANIFAYQKKDMLGITPAIRLMSGGSNRTRLTHAGYTPEFHVAVQLFTLYEDPDSGWTEENAEDQLDTMENLVANFLLHNQRTANWKWIQFEDISEVMRVDISGKFYLMETILLQGGSLY